MAQEGSRSLSQRVPLGRPVKWEEEAEVDGAAPNDFGSLLVGREGDSSRGPDTGAAGKVCSKDPQLNLAESCIHGPSAQAVQGLKR